MKKIITLVLLIAFFSSCDRCKDVECVTPAPLFEFEILDKQTKENLFTNGTFSENQISIKTQEDKEVPYSFIGEGGRNTIRLLGLGWKTQKIHYTINIADELIFDLKVDVERKKGDCCDFTEVQSLAIKNIEFNIDKSTGLISIWVVR